MTATATNPQDRAALREKKEVNDDLSKAQFDLTEELEVFLTMDKKVEQSNFYRMYQEDEQRLITNRGKVYMLISKWKQTLFGNGDSPYGNILVSLPISRQ